VIGNIDQWIYDNVSGWAADDTHPEQIISVELKINGNPACRIPAMLYREDLEKAGLGHGKHGFSFDPRPFLMEGANHLEITISGTNILLGEQNVVNIERGNLLEISQLRWKGDELAEGLTWGRPMTGDSFVDVLLSYWRPDHHARVLEVGPGYGRILSTLLQRNIPFRTYCGIEISAPRVARLRQQFIDRRIRFDCEDINSYQFPEPVDLVISSATFVHLYPDCSTALRNIREHTSSKALIAIDFIDPAHYSTGRGFDHTTGTFVIGYSQDELRELFSRNAYNVIAMPEFVIGVGAMGEIFGLMVIARPAGN
jgi:SAM-dependent methyltransferase